MNTKQKNVWYNSLMRVMSPRTCAEQGLEVDAEAQQVAYTAYCDDVAINYAASQANMSEEAQAEIAFEQRAAFGEGVELIDVVTGKRSIS